MTTYDVDGVYRMLGTKQEEYQRVTGTKQEE